MGQRSALLASPVGPLTAVVDDDGALVSLRMDRWRSVPPQAEPGPVPRAVPAQLEAYFAGELRRFDLPLAAPGTAFQQRVWDALRAVPYGATCRYGDIAARLESPGASRAVGLATGRNPTALVVPCHRVVGSTGSLTGYAGGLERKRWLLDHEQRHAAAGQPDAGA